MRRRFELNGEYVQTETRQCDVDCWELRITDEEGNVAVQYFSDPSLLDKAATKAHPIGKTLDGYRSRSTIGFRQAIACQSRTARGKP